MENICQGLQIEGNEWRRNCVSNLFFIIDLDEDNHIHVQYLHKDKANMGKLTVPKIIFN